MNKKKLKSLYLDQKLSSHDVAGKLGYSESKINYWLKKLKITKRNLSEAIYYKRNPDGDPFKFSMPRSTKQMFLFGLGLGLFWSEGTKRGRHAVRLSNSDPVLVKKYLDFLVEIYKIDKNRLRFQLQTYDDFDVDRLVLFWKRHLSIKKSQFYKSTILIRRGKGTYHEKMKHGVLIVSFNNMKLKNLISDHIASIASV